MTKISETQIDAMPAKRRSTFAILAVLTPVILLLVFELILRLFSYGHSMNLIINHPSKNYSSYYTLNPLIGEKYFNTFEATGGVNDIFLKQKPENSFRIFVLGSSSLVGFPYDKNLMASRIMHKRLQDAYPDKEIEVVNTAITAINSITLNDYMNEIVKYSPDAILIYAGHNEFYGAFGVGSNETMSQNKFIRNVHFNLMKWRTYQLMRSAYSAVGRLISNKPNVAESKGSLMKRIVADPDIVYGSEKYYIGINQYRSNMAEILNKAKQNNIHVFISDLVSNVKDIAPMGNNNEALTLYNQAIEQLQGGNTAAAKVNFYKAKDLDPVRFRASEEINEIIDSLAKAYDCYFISSKTRFEAEAVNGIIGSDLLTEHVHPNIKGQFVLADAFYTSIVNSQLIAAQTSKNNLRGYEYYQANWGYTALDSLIGEFTVKQLKSYWPFVPLTNTVTFRDTFKPQSLIDSLAFSVLLTNKPKVAELHEQIASECLANNDYINALKEYETLALINPYWPTYSNQAANCLLKLNDLYSAENYLKKSLRYKKTYFAQLMYAEILFIKHNFNDAISSYESALQLAENESEQTEVLKKLYLVYSYNKQNEKADEVRSKLKTLQVSYDEPTQNLTFPYSTYIPYNIKTLMLKVDEKVRKSEVDSALIYLEKAVMINDAPVANKLIGDILYNKKDNRLLYFYTKAYDAYAFDPTFLRSYCIANYVNGKFDEAKQVLARIKELSPDYSEISMLENLLKKK